ncbi:MAG: GntR family transcriptional regulator [Acidobacteria bacterium]|nr:GntR family transcriptional regulator [Acidobacteriota bacterium]
MSEPSDRAEPSRRKSSERGLPEKRAHRFENSGIPLYYQLATLVREKIASREYRPGDQIPPESKLVSSYGVSRMTVRQAMAGLEEEGLIRKEPGRGTFVSDTATSGGDLELDRSIEDLISMGQATSVQLLELRETDASAREALDLKMPEGTPVLRCKRLRLLGNQPYCYIVNHVPIEIGRRIPESNWHSGSVLKFIEDELGIPLRVAKQRVRATLADANLAQSLDTRIGAPLLLVDYHIRTDEDRPVEMAELYYRSDLYSFTLHLTRSDDDDPKGPWSLEGHRLEQ